MNKINLKSATFGAGCFWGVEEAFRNVPGVIETRVGYMGGSTKDPTYKQVCTDKTGHAEVVQLKYDPGMISYRALLNIFFKIHDPTQVNRQGPDVGTQYRSVVFFHDDEQRTQAERIKHEIDLSARFPDPVRTQITPAPDFYQAEEYHQKYIQKQGGTSCH